MPLTFSTPGTSTSYRYSMSSEFSERERYVPNVVYTCGAMRHRDLIILPYAVSDTFSNFATIRPRR